MSYYKPIDSEFRIRRGTAQRWEELNPILAAGEPGYEKDTGQLKIGDGLSKWTELEYMNISNKHLQQLYNVLDERLIIIEEDATNMDSILQNTIITFEEIIDDIYIQLENNKQPPQNKWQDYL